MPNRRLVVPALLAVVATGLALAQPGSGQPGNQPAGQPGTRPGGTRPGGGGPGGGQPFNPQEFIDRLMAGDADGDGKLARSEVSGPIANRFDSIDGNSDGFLDRAELQAAASAFGGGRMRLPMGRAMENVEEALHALQDSALDASTMAADLERVQAMQEGLIAAKYHVAGYRFEAAVLEHFEGDEAEARAEMREHMIESIDLALDLEVALMDGDAEAARQMLAEIEELEEHSHEEFRVD